DIKVTDLLYRCVALAKETGECGEVFVKIRERFVGIVRELGLSLDIDPILDEIEEMINETKSSDYAASRGEYLSARIMSALLGYTFIDAKDVIRFDENGALDEGSYELIAQATAAHPHAVIPGFYGTDVNGNVKTFSRGGSDITGSIVARGVGAVLYENWTDVSGFLACDPRIVNGAKSIAMLSYKELRELSYMGANVLHSESIFPVRKANIPIRILNTFRPQDEGTLILPSVHYNKHSHSSIVTGIAGKKDFTVIFVEKSLMNYEVGFTRKILSVLESHNISFEHMPSGIDTLSLIIESAKIPDINALLAEIREAVHPDYMRVLNEVALVATVGHGMSASIGTSARLFKALSDTEINVRMIDQGSSELNIIVGVDNADCEKCIAAIYHEFFDNDEIPAFFD
ncbi:MAG: aspartate kinase, partial [Christensenellaceae bacterium]